MIVLVSCLGLIIVIIIIKRSAIIKVMRRGRGMGTIVCGGESFRGQNTRDRQVPLPSTPPLCTVFFPPVTTGNIWGYVLVVVLYIGYDSSGYLLNRLLVVGGIYFL